MCGSMTLYRLMLRPAVVRGLIVAASLSPAYLSGQTGVAGSLSGTVTDRTGRPVAGADIEVTSKTTSFARALHSNAQGNYIVPLLPPDVYAVTATYTGFAPVTADPVRVDILTTTMLDLHFLSVVASQQVSVVGQPEAAQWSESTVGGTVTSHDLVVSLPLSSRNYTQIIGLDAGVAAEVANAGALGRGDTSYSAGPTGFSSNGAGTNDNNFQMNGVDVNDIEGSGFLSRGIPVPNPDTIEEFLVSTQPYDSALGRNAGANVNVVTRAGTEAVHGSVFEYFRNDLLDANTYFRNRSGQSRGTLKQNQFGGTLSGPVLARKLLAFGSYQQTMQSNGIDSVCSDSVSLPLLTNDRSSAGLGAAFGGERGYFQNALGGIGPAIAPDGSNISPVALRILQQKNKDGSYLIPTPQIVVSSGGNPDARGLATFSIPCSFTERQGVLNADWQVSYRDRFSARTFAANGSETQTLPVSFLGGSGLPSFPYQADDRFRSLSIENTWAASANLLNQFEFGFNRARVALNQQYPFTFSSVGANVPGFDDTEPVLTIAGVAVGGQGEAFAGAINTFTLQNTLTYVHGRHFVHAGGGITRIQENQPHVLFHAANLFLSFADFVLGQNASQNGTGAICALYGCGAGYSDIAYAQDLAGLVQREYRVLSGNFYVQDSVRVTPQLTLNLGVRFERIGDFSDRLGHNVSFFPELANPNPPSTGSLQGYVVQANYPGVPPTGVTTLGNNYGIYGTGQNTWQPRVALAWRVLGGTHLLLHAGYGVFRSRLTGDAYNQSIFSPPFTQLRQFQGADPVSASLSLAQPLPPFNTALPAFQAYCPPTSTACGIGGLTFTGFASNAQPPFYGRYNVDLEGVLTPSLTLDIGYAGARGTHLVREVYPDQAALATVAAPIRGQTTNTLANLPYRVPIPGFNTNNLAVIQTSGADWYNSLQTSMHGRSARVGEILVSYTWARLLADSYSGLSATHGGVLLGNQFDAHASYGTDSFLRNDRLLVSYSLIVPSPASRVWKAWLGSWRFSGVATAQSGHRLAATDQNQFSVYGVKGDRAEIVAGCHPALQGSAESRLTKFFDTSCFSAPPVVGDDHVATTFGNSPIGAIPGPRQANVDLALARDVPLGLRRMDSSVNLRIEAYNVFNHPLFADPDSELTSATFGQILSTGNARIVQLAARIHF